VREDDAADRPGEIADRECRKRHDQLDDRVVAGRKDRRADVAREHAEDDEVVKLEGAAEAGQQNDPPAGGRDAIRSRCH
jgi:hypothetical protein